MSGSSSVSTSIYNVGISNVDDKINNMEKILRERIDFQMSVDPKNGRKLDLKLRSLEKKYDHKDLKYLSGLTNISQKVIKHDKFYAYGEHNGKKVPIFINDVSPLIKDDTKTEEILSIVASMIVRGSDLHGKIISGNLDPFPPPTKDGKPSKQHRRQMREEFAALFWFLKTAAELRRTAKFDGKKAGFNKGAVTIPDGHLIANFLKARADVVYYSRWSSHLPKLTKAAGRDQFGFDFPTDDSWFKTPFATTSDEAKRIPVMLPGGNMRTALFFEIDPAKKDETGMATRLYLKFERRPNYSLVRSTPKEGERSRNASDFFNTPAHLLHYAERVLMPNKDNLELPAREVHKPEFKELIKQLIEVIAPHDVDSAGVLTRSLSDHRELKRPQLRRIESRASNLSAASSNSIRTLTTRLHDILDESLGNADSEEEKETFAHEIALTHRSIEVLKRALNMIPLEEEPSAMDGSEILEIGSLTISQSQKPIENDGTA